MNLGSLRRRVTVVLGMALLAAASVGAEEIGEVSALAEPLSIIRDGELFPGAVEGGLAVEAEDLLLTQGGFAEVLLDDLGRLRLWPETVVHLRGSQEVADAEDERAMEVELLAGTVTLRRLGGSEPVALLSGAIEVLVRAGEVTVGAYAGDLRLVVSERGRQMVRSEAGATRFAEADVPVGYDGRLRNLEEAPLLWRRRGIEEFSSLGPGAMSQRFQEYLDLRARFDRAYQDLLTHRRVLNRWSFRESRGLTVGVEGDLAASPGLPEALRGVLEVGELMEARYYQLRMDAPYLSEEYREHLENEEAFLPERLHFLRFLRAVTLRVGMPGSPPS
jgi:hypothetical protein